MELGSRQLNSSKRLERLDRVESVSIVGRTIEVRGGLILADGVTTTGDLNLTGDLDLTGNLTVTGSVEVVGAQQITSTIPQLILYQTDQGANGKVWDLFSTGTDFVVATTDDAVTTAENAYRIGRSGQTVQTHRWYTSGGTERMRLNVSGVLTGYTVPACRVYHNANQAINNTTTTKLSFNSERYDTDTMHSTSSDTSRITITTAGIYRFTATATWGGHTSVRTILSLKLNNNTYIGRTESASSSASTSFTQNCTATWQCAANDYVEVDAYQDSGGAVNVIVLGEAISPEFSAERIG